jgi:chromosome segregation ATPase
MRALARACFTLWLLAAALAPGPAGLRAQEVADLEDAAALAAWRERLGEAHAAREDARHRVETAHDAYADWRQRKYPRGVRKEKLVQEVADAELALAEAQAAWEALQEDARRAGVPPGVLRDYE